MEKATIEEKRKFVQTAKVKFNSKLLSLEQILWV